MTTKNTSNNTINSINTLFIANEEVVLNQKESANVFGWSKRVLDGLIYYAAQEAAFSDHDYEGWLRSFLVMSGEEARRCLLKYEDSMREGFWVVQYDSDGLGLCSNADIIRVTDMTFEDFLEANPPRTEVYRAGGTDDCPSWRENTYGLIEGPFYSAEEAWEYTG